MRMRLRSPLAVGGAVAVAVAVTVTLAPGADAAITASTLVNPASGKCLSVAGASSANGTPVEIWTCDGGANQR